VSHELADVFERDAGFDEAGGVVVAPASGEVVAAYVGGVADSVDDVVDGSGCDFADVGAVGLAVGVGEQVLGFGELWADVFEVLSQNPDENGWDRQPRWLRGRRL
jgi:hypothetical protein